MQQDRLGSLAFKKKSFPGISDLIRSFKSAEFQLLNAFQRQLKVSEALFQLIDTSKQRFLLCEVIDFIERISEEEVCEKFNFSFFELWLNQFAEIDQAKNLYIRGKIVGKQIPRSEYQEMFPIGMGKMYDGSHVVTAHSSPDLDTIVASFWGFIDAFAARVGSGIHIWNIPGGPPSGLIELNLLFNDIFGKGVFTFLSRSRSSLGLSSFELLTQQGLVKKRPKDLIFEFTHQRLQSAVIIVDDNGRYIGDWRSVDVEGVRQVINLFNTHLRFLEYFFQINLITLFTKQTLERQDFLDVIDKIYHYQFKTFEPSKDLTKQQLDQLSDYMKNVLFIQNGLGSTFEELIHTMEKQGVSDFSDFHKALRELYLDDLFDQEGKLREDRPLIFARLERVVSSLSLALRKLRTYVDSLGVGFRIKEKVLGHQPTYLGHRSDIAEIRAKMDAYPYLTVNYSSQTGDMHPLGVIYSSDINRPILGTVSLRDFSNLEETKVPSYLEVISAIDHHKTSLTNGTPSKLIVSDVQSVNILVAQMSFRINDKYSFGGMTKEQVERQLQEIIQNETTSSTLRIQQKLLMRKRNMLTLSESGIDPEREFIEYLHFMYAIFDDTDLLTKVSAIDVQVVADLLNRLKSLSLQKEVEVVHFDDLDEHHDDFVKQAAKRLLIHPDLYSLYAKVYKERERMITEQLKNVMSQEGAALFEDTKIQNGCARVGQKKVFAKNIQYLRKHAGEILHAWVDESRKVVKDRPEIDLHLLMISTIASAEELFQEKSLEYHHQDELWIYIPSTEVAIQHLKLFLSAFSRSPYLVKEHLKVEFLGSNGQELATIFKESFIPCEFIFNGYNIPVAIIHYKAGSINSRKSMISPYLPKPGGNG